MLSLTDITKTFPGVKALQGVSLDVQPGEIHALAGENGAGKSTLTRVIAGVHTPTEGTMSFAGRPVAWTSPREATAAGIHVIYQEFNLFPHLSAAENIYIGHERRNALGFVDHRRTRRDAAEILKRLGVTIDPEALVNELSVADQQMVEIARALVHDVKLLILDEPTAVISGREVDLLFDRLHALKREGVAIIYISHRLEEIFAHCDRVSVLKDGRHVATRACRRHRPGHAGVADGRPRHARTLPAAASGPRRTRRWCSKPSGSMSPGGCAAPASRSRLAPSRGSPAW